MLFSIALLIIVVVISLSAAPKMRQEDAHIHGAGQIGVLAAIALFGVDYFTSYYYATGEMMSALHPYGLQRYSYIAVTIIAFANFVFGMLYMYSLGPFNEGGGSYTASMRYLKPTLSLVVAVTLIQDYVLTRPSRCRAGTGDISSAGPSYRRRSACCHASRRVRGGDCRGRPLSPLGAGGRRHGIGLSSGGREGRHGRGNR